MRIGATDVEIKSQGYRILRGRSLPITRMNPNFVPGNDIHYNRHQVKYQENCSALVEWNDTNETDKPFHANCSG